jgi:hypothetical protein
MEMITTGGGGWQILALRQQIVLEKNVSKVKFFKKK